MPQYKPVTSLREVALQYVTRNIEYWCREYAESFLPAGRFIYVLGPFQDVPSVLLEELIQSLKQQKKLRRHHLHLLIVSHLSKLNLSREHTDLPFILELAAFKCKHLKELDLSYCTKIPRNALKEAIPSFPQLENINLAWSNVTDDVLATLGAYATNLRSLDLEGCNISDFAITSLCLSGDPSDSQASRFGKCSQLVRLGLIDTMVERDGVRCAIENLPSLRSLEWKDTVRVLDYMYGKKWDGQERDSLPQLHLSDLYLDGSQPIRPDIFELCVKVCPKAYKLTVTDMQCISPSYLLPLMELPALTDLCIVGGAVESGPEMFASGICPLLVRHGETLKKLFLAELPSASVEIIGKNCVNLDDLHLSYIDTFYDPPPDKKKAAPAHLPFAHLKTLKCTGTSSDTSLSESNLKLLLSSQKLEYVFIRDCSSLTDGVLASVMSKNKLPNLIHLELEECKNVTAVPIKRLLQLKNPLKTLKLWDCVKITRADSDNFVALIKKKKWNIDFEWN